MQLHLRSWLQILISPRRHGLLSFLLGWALLFGRGILGISICVHLEGVFAIIRFEGNPNGYLVILEARS